MENDNRAQCFQCKYWSGHLRERQGVVMCAVNIPRPSAVEMKKSGDRIAFTWHNCPDFKEEEEDLDELTCGHPGHWDEDCG